ncbi:2-oxoglutarate-dependent dioxygenase DAO-like [Prosopis cineraria]|uniref:2-oxoglutarate-dependent dioxygenase DAO-like n=1 Tax=Prosopis cineraria TaxID=364024 RepID=UPI0024108E78|nr:2-oxoglutarate-dependent dioxygenase DAO-like [Prosopis cineraria]
MVNMSTSMKLSIPIIDMQKLPEEEEYKKLREACEQWGCFRVMNRAVPLKLMEEMKKVATCLADRPLEIKKRNVDVTKGSGFTAISLNPIYENIGIHDVASSVAVNDFCSQMDASPQERETVKAYLEVVHELAVDTGVNLKECFVGLLSSSLSSETRDDLKDWRCQFKINKFNYSPETVGLLGLKEHTDPGFVTVLQDDELIGGLEAFNTSSGFYVDVPPISGTFVINLGDVAHVWSNGRIMTVNHHVVCKEGKSRIYVVTSIFGPKNGDVEVAKEFVDCDHPCQFKPFNFKNYLETRWSTNLRVGEALEFLRVRPSNTEHPRLED